ncbi:YjgB family protein [Brevibacillus sp. SAFN-007a]|uniref:YjgB family protein n=1 Tax=Brevibacillus sp. SAFN-007a TaxID=3436862 RepID=UPI003F7EC6DE
MPFKTDEQLLDEMKGLPDMKMREGKKQAILSTIRSADAHARNSSAPVPSGRRFSGLGKGLAVCSVLAATIWMGATLVSNHQPSALPDVSASPTPGSTSASPGPDAGKGTAVNPVPVSPQSDQLLPLIRTEAEKGKGVFAPYTVENTVFDQVEKDWGKPDHTMQANGLTYSSYAKRGVAFGYNKGMQLVDIRTTDPRLQQIRLSDVEKAWGKPNRVSEFGNQTLYTYDVTSKYQVKFSFQGGKSAGDTDLVLVQYNVYYPQGNKNLMLYGSNIAILQDLRELAKNGQTIGSEYRVEQDVFDEIEKQIGKPDVVSYVNGLTYNTYRDRGLVFAFNKGMQVVDIRSYDYRLQAITQAEVLQALGKPSSTATVAGQTIYTYQVTPDYELKIIFSQTAGAAENLYIDHVNIFYPRGTINNMAG